MMRKILRHTLYALLLMSMPLQAATIKKLDVLVTGYVKKHERKTKLLVSQCTSLVKLITQYMTYFRGVFTLPSDANIAQTFFCPFAYALPNNCVVAKTNWTFVEKIFPFRGEKQQLLHVHTLDKNFPCAEEYTMHSLFGKIKCLAYQKTPKVHCLAISSDQCLGIIQCNSSKLKLSEGKLVILKQDLSYPIAKIVFSQSGKRMMTFQSRYVRYDASTDEISVGLAKKLAIWDLSTKENIFSKAFDIHTIVPYTFYENIHCPGVLA